ncbi:hypothetical protein [Neisseria dentiae]|uniref:hypothetical protein n=1 Tax=Neisseria dentiae TaxID=194197 RepID=UPI001301D8B9|nr:hypothetical protein [Neisseria dentiae]QMT44305.1 hypothetical protein H3L92_07380 [Neisseria dentiae]
MKRFLRENTQMPDKKHSKMEHLANIFNAADADINQKYRSLRLVFGGITGIHPQSSCPIPARISLIGLIDQQIVGCHIYNQRFGKQTICRTAFA